MGKADVPIDALPVRKMTVPEPVFSAPAVKVIAPPVVLPPVLVTIEIVPPAPTVTLRRAAVPVPPPAAFTLIATADAVALVVVIEPLAPIEKASAPAALVFTS